MKKIWTKEKIEQEALKFTTIKDFREKSYGAYQAALKIGILKEILPNLIGKKTKWTKDELKIEALKYKTRSEFAKNSNAYQVAHKNGTLEEICKHMPKHASIGGKCSIVKWTKETIFEKSSMYMYKSQFQKEYPGAYRAAKRLKIWEEASSHMSIDARIGKEPKCKVWTKELTHIEALKYKTRGEFQFKSLRAYLGAKRLGILEDICSHMAPSSSTSFPELNIYDIVKEIYPNTKKLRDRKVKIEKKPYIKGFDIDIFIPELNKGIELDGVYWHSFKQMRKSPFKQNWTDEDIHNYHQIKDDYFLSKGIKLLHITDLEWIANKEQSLIKILDFLEN